MSEAYGDWLERNDHPLLNPVTLKKIFGHLRGKDLKECRVVCKTWNILTIPFTHKTFRVNIHGDREHRIENFVKVFGSNKLGIPFARYRLGSFCTTDGPGQEFLQLCGNTIKDIIFLNDTFRIEDVGEILKSTLKLETLRIPEHLHSSSGNIAKLFSEDLKPRLTRLTDLTVFFDNPKKRNRVCPTFLEELISATENISCVHLQDSTPVDEEEEAVCSSFEVLSLIEKLGKEPTVQEIDISHKKSDNSDYVELLRKMAAKPNGLKLKRLDYEAVYSDRDSQTIFDVISLFTDTLECLKINVYHFTSFMAFSKMTRLTHLVLDNLSKEFNSRLVNLSKIFPVLESLSLHHLDDGICDEFFPESEPCLTLKSLKLDWVSLKINGFNQLLTIFPNVTDFEVEIEQDGEEILRQVWTGMPQLESLEVSGTIRMKDSLDSLLTGIPNPDLHEIRDIVNSLEKMTTEVERREAILNLRNQHSQHPSITNLKRLRSLRLELTGVKIDTYSGRCLTDLSGYLGLYSMECLKHLYVFNSEMKKSCCEILVKDMGLKSWAFMTEEY